MLTTQHVINHFDLDLLHHPHPLHHIHSHSNVHPRLTFLQINNVNDHQHQNVKSHLVLVVVFHHYPMELFVDFSRIRTDMCDQVCVINRTVKMFFFCEHEHHAHG